MDFLKNVSLSKNDANHLVLRINEDVKAGTLIDLNAITDIDTSFIGNLNSLIDQKKMLFTMRKLRLSVKRLKGNMKNILPKLSSKRWIIIKRNLMQRF